MTNYLSKFIQDYRSLVEYNGMCKNIPILFNEKHKTSLIIQVFSSRRAYIQACKKNQRTASVPEIDINACVLTSVYSGFS